MRKQIRQWSCGILLVVVAMPALAACGGATPIAADDAVAHYDSAADAAVGALADSAGDGSGDSDGEWMLAEDTRTVTENDGACEYTPGTWSPVTSLPSADDELWQQRLDALNPVLAEHGFEQIDATTQDGSRDVVESTDGHGATLQVTAEGQVRIWGAVVDADPCEPARLGLD